MLELGAVFLYTIYMNKILVFILLIAIVGIAWFVSLHNSTDQELSVAEQTVLEDFKLLQEETRNTVTTLPAHTENEEPVASVVVTRAPVVAPVVVVTSCRYASCSCTTSS